jgi:tellurite resistance-related uncharacterized protein
MHGGPLQTEAVTSATTTAASSSSTTSSGKKRPAGLPADVLPYRRTALFTETTVPAGLLREHTTRAGTWGLIHVEEGQLRYRVTDPRRTASERLLTSDKAEEAGLIEPTILHCVQPIGTVKFFVEFHKVDSPPKKTTEPDA